MNFQVAKPLLYRPTGPACLSKRDIRSPCMAADNKYDNQSLSQRVESVRRQLQAARLAGRPLELERLVATFPEAERAELLTEALLLEWTDLHNRGETFVLEEYRCRFPYLQASVDSAWERWKKDHETLMILNGQQTTSPPETSPPALAQTQPLGHPIYEQVTPVGKGAMGEVYKAFDPGLKRWVALKQVCPELIGQGAVARFRREAQVLAGLNHPHIVKVHDCRDRDGQLTLVMEFVPGGTLEDRLGEVPLEKVEAARLVAILAWTVHAAHEARIIHRDLKPANILMGASVPGNPGNVLGGFPKISDFGLAKCVEGDTDPSPWDAIRGTPSGGTVEQAAGKTQGGTIMGTPNYMSPEQANGETDAIGPPTDVWALGVILYRCLTGKCVRCTRCGPICRPSWSTCAWPACPARRGNDRRRKRWRGAWTAWRGMER
jgi:hypothetical protein